jgi:hypothetical protein
VELAEGLAPPVIRGLQPRAFAARPRQHGSGRRARTSTLLVQSQPAYPFAHPRTRCRCVHRDQVSNLESSRSERDVLPIPPSLCTQTLGWRSGAATPVYMHECVRMRARGAHASTRARLHPIISVSNFGIHGVKEQGPSSTDLVIGGDSRYGTTKKDLASARPFDVREMFSGY